MAVSMSDSKILPETVVNLRDRLKHGQNVTKILESQLDTAQQNITLLQGQVRLANETIVNLKKHFHETENILSQLLSPEYQSCVTNLDSESKDNESEVSQKHGSVDSTTRSPVPDVIAEKNKAFEDKVDGNNKSPYAQQLRQVLDVLQDEEPRKAVVIHHPEVTSNKECTCVECQTQRKQFDEPIAKGCNCGSSACDLDHYQNKRNEYCKTKHRVNGHSLSSHVMSPKIYGRGESSHDMYSNYSNHCTGPCCSNNESPGYKVMEKSPVRYVHSPVRISEGGIKHTENHHSHCGEKCSCHSYFNYASYGYHVVEGGVPDSIQPMSPSARRKRSFVPLMPGEEPPHLKYTKVKRIDGNKLTAQKTLQDFTKRRFLPYNPQFDLDLLIVPPPIPALDLIKGNSGGKNTNGPFLTHGQYQASMHQDDNPNDQINGRTVNSNNNNLYVHSLFKPSSTNMNLLPVIKEEIHEGHIIKLREANSSSRSQSPLREADNGYTNTLKQEKIISPVSCSQIC